MTTTTETQTARPKQIPAFYIFDNATNGEGSAPVGAVFKHRKGTGYTVLIGEKRYAAFAPKPKANTAADVQPEGGGA